MMVMRKTFGAGLAVLVVGSLLAATASADLVLELRMPGGAPPAGNIVLPADPGAPVTLEVWGVLTEGTNPMASQLMGAYVGAFSSDGGALLGDMTYTIAGPTDVPPIYWTFITLPVAPTDFDGDGDLDAFGGDPTNYLHFNYWSRSPFMNLTPGTTGLEQKLGTLEFMPTGVFNDETSATEIMLVGGTVADAQQPSSWTEDGVNETGVPGVANKAVLVIPSDAQPVADANMGATGMLGGNLSLDGTVAIGSVNWWRWDFGGGMHVVEGVGEGTPDIPVDDLLAAGLAMGMNPVEVTVGWSASDPVNQSSAMFDVNLMPEPATMALLGLGLAVLARRRK